MTPDPWASNAEKFERAYRGNSAKRPLTPQQKILETSFKKKSVGEIGKRAGATTSKSAHRASQARANRLKASNAVKGTVNNLSSSASKFRASSAKNISKFGGGVAKQFAPTVNSLKTIAVSQGANVRTLAALMNNSKFLAGTKSIPGLGLVVGNYVVWKRNIELLEGIYGVSLNPLARYNPFRKSVINEGSSPPFLGGQSSNVTYLVKVTGKKYYAGSLIQVYSPVNNATVTGAIKDIKVVNPSGNFCSVQVVSSNSDGTPRSFDYPVGGFGIDFEITLIEITRADGQPDTGGNLPGETQAETSQGGTTVNQITTVNNITNVNNVYNNTSPVPTVPPVQVVNNYYTSPSESKIEFVPVIVPPVEPLADDNTEKQPQSPSDSPIVKTEDTNKSTEEKKPSEASKLMKKSWAISYDEAQQQKYERIHGTISKDITFNDFLHSEETERKLRIKKLDDFGNPVYYDPTVNEGKTAFVRKTVTPTARTVTTTPTIEKNSSEESKLPVIVPGLYKTPAVTTKVNLPPVPPIPPTPVDPCKKGCGGNTPAPTTNNSSELNTGLNPVELALLNKIDKTTVSTNKVITHKDHGLQKMQEFANAAWETTRADKILGGINTMLNIHNAVMLSNALGSTLNLIASQSLEAMNITDATTGNPINVGSVIKNKLNSIISSLIGANNYAALTAKLRTYNRIYQTGANVLYSVRSIIDSTQDIAETTGENVAAIGNALRKAGAVRENAYKLMPTDFRNPSRVQRRLEKLGETASVIEEITSDAVDLKDEVKELKGYSKEFEDELKKETDKQIKAETLKKRDAIKTPEPKEEDETRAVEPDKKESAS
jgi:hypothetical protein